jgi:hypothetical protein
MENISICFQDKEQTSIALAESITVLAKSSYLIAEVFSQARKEFKTRHIEDANDQD